MNLVALPSEAYRPVTAGLPPDVCTLPYRYHHISNCFPISEGLPRLPQDYRDNPFVPLNIAVAFRAGHIQMASRLFRL